MRCWSCASGMRGAPGVYSSQYAHVRLQLSVTTTWAYSGRASKTRLAPVRMKRRSTAIGLPSSHVETWADRRGGAAMPVPLSVHQRAPAAQGPSSLDALPHLVTMVWVFTIVNPVGEVIFAEASRLAN